MSLTEPVNIRKYNFYIFSIDKLIHDTEAAFINDLEGGDRQKAMKRLRVPPLGYQQSPWTTFKLGLFCGAFIVLVIAVILSGIFYDYRYVFKEPFSIENRIFRLLFFIVNLWI